MLPKLNQFNTRFHKRNDEEKNILIQGTRLVLHIAFQGHKTRRIGKFSFYILIYLLKISQSYNLFFFPDLIRISGQECKLVNLLNSLGPKSTRITPTIQYLEQSRLRYQPLIRRRPIDNVGGRESDSSDRGSGSSARRSGSIVRNSVLV